MPRPPKTVNRLLQRMMAPQSEKQPSASALFDRAFQAHKAGKFAEAEAGYRRLLDLDPQHADGCNLLGIMLQQKGANEEAEQCIRQALALRQDARFFFALANLLHQTGRLEEAEASFRRTLELAPDQADAWNNLGNLFGQTLRLTDAEAAYERAIAIRPDFAHAHNNLGNLFKATNRIAQAERAYLHVLQLQPQHAEAWNNLGAVLKATGRPAEAEMALKRAIDLLPTYADAHINLAALFADSGRPDEAEAGYRRALALDPHSPDAYNNLGILMQRTGRAAEAEAALRQALALAPAFAQAHNNLGNILKENDRLADAILAYRQAVELQPLYADAHNNLGTALKETGQFDAAQASYGRALEIAPDNADARLNHAMFLLLQGDLRRGWQEYESRWKTTGAKLPPYSQPLWHGAIDPAGKTIFLHSEQGFGDTLQFIRYAKLLAARGATVYAGVPSELKTLIATCPGVARVFDSGDPIPSFDYHCPLMSLPLAFDTELATIPAAVPYLASNPDKAAWWRNRLGPTSGLRVGIVWAGNARRHNPSVHAVDRQRSLHVERYAPLLALPGITFFSLQVGTEAALQAKAHPVIIDFSTDLLDFSDTAALIGELDLVISVDTAIAHLAGALGKPVWMLNRYNTCWRWLIERDDSPWYPSMRIFRQAQPGDWDEVIYRVRDALVAQARR